MGGKDVIYLKQQHSSTLQPADVQKKLKEMADRRFLDANGHYSIASDQVFPNDKVCEEFWAQGPIFIYPAMYIFCYFMKTSEYGSLRLDGSEIWLSLLLYFALIFHAFNVIPKLTALYIFWLNIVRAKERISAWTMRYTTIWAIKKKIQWIIDFINWEWLINWEEVRGESKGLLKTWSWRVIESTILHYLCIFNHSSLILYSIDTDPEIISVN